MQRKQLENAITAAGAALAAVGICLCIPKVRRTVADRASGLLERTRGLQSRDLMAAAGAAAAKAALTGAAKQAVMTAKDQLL